MALRTLCLDISTSSLAWYVSECVWGGGGDVGGGGLVEGL